MKKKVILPLLSILFLASCGQPSEAPITEPQKTEPVETAPVTEPIEDFDIVGQTKINLDDDLFEKVMKKKGSTDFAEDCCDMNVDGVERMLTTSDYPVGGEKEVFTNYVDGDTTSFTSYNGLYTVKVRYLAVDTPESTSEIEEWGKSASNFNKEKLKSAKHVIVQSAGCAKTGKVAVADLDGYQRTLAYVWYTDKENPTKDDFRNLNLELVYEGFSIFSGSRDEMEENFYDAFMKANDIARAYKKHIYTDKEQADPNYYYGDPKPLGLDQIYDKSLYTNKTDTGISYSVFCDEYTKWTFEGVVSRKVGNAFYLQDTINGKAYGLYVFTLRSYAPVKVGNRLKVSGVLSYYGGAYELTGVSYSMFDHAPGDIEYVKDASGKNVVEEVTPIEATTAQIKSGMYDCVLVKVKDSNAADNNIYFNTTWSQYGDEVTSFAYGGEEELNGYNSTHPYYNTSNDIIIFGRAGNKMENVDNFSTLSSSNEYLRIKIPDSVRVNDENNETITSYRYFTGTSDINGVDAPVYYVPKDPQLAFDLTNKKVSYDSLTEEQKANISVKSYQPKYVTEPVGIAQQYVSTSGNAMYSLNICSYKDFKDFTEYVGD